MAKRLGMEESRRVATGRPKYARQVEVEMARLGGMRRSDLTDDRARGAGSPLGKRMEKGRGR